MEGFTCTVENAKVFYSSLQLRPLYKGKVTRFCSIFFPIFGTYHIAIRPGVFVCVWKKKVYMFHGPVNNEIFVKQKNIKRILIFF